MSGIFGTGAGADVEGHGRALLDLLAAGGSVRTTLPSATSSSACGSSPAMVRPWFSRIVLASAAGRSTTSSTCTVSTGGGGSSSVALKMPSGEREQQHGDDADRPPLALTPPSPRARPCGCLPARPRRASTAVAAGMAWVRTGEGRGGRGVDGQPRWTRLDVGAHVGSALVAVVDALGQRPSHDVVDPRR